MVRMREVPPAFGGVERSRGGHAPRCGRALWDVCGRGEEWSQPWPTAAAKRRCRGAGLDCEGT
eukprot:5917217-Prymnesium_polylepis.1